ncbi:uncharacterized protein CDV56_104808 [Aspergillus thermomutatus]|uniref:Uncharacterized protein n=1 Tax=Aspergillus thermomutatus TaxID=41047 RepID=A0A397GLU9_ASPTH|nr:uncharacterized protein CDV56_104808 [Aspergillus thermomutatus]RHZ50514.1 hypothetical protein CDV56_104808 [Aspergillus thermomutatus]
MNIYALTLGAAAILLTFIFRQLYQRWHKSHILDHIPTHAFPDGNNTRPRYISELKDLLESGYRRYNKQGRAFKVPIPIGGYSVKYRVVLPKDHLEEMKHLSNNIFSWAKASDVIFAQDYTGAPKRGPWSGKALRVGIHQNLGDITKQLERRIDQYFHSHLPSEPNSGVATIKFMEFFVPAIANVTNSLLVGEKLASDPEWMAQTIDFAVNRYKSADDVRAWPPSLAAMISPLIPSVRRLRQSKEYVKAQLRPMYEELKRQDALGAGEKAKYRKGLFGYEWLWGGAPDDVTLDDFSETMMRTIIASIHTSAKTISIALIDMLSQPHYLEELRQEAAQATLPNGSVNMDALVQLDCFLKESQRLTPVFLLTMNRVVTQEYTFKVSGTRLPIGTMTTAATAAIATDPDTFGADSNEFDGHRFTRIRENNKAGESTFKMGMATEDSLGFGLGSQACPGRFFAVNLMKLMLAKLITRWELRLEKEGIPYSGGRPKYEYYDFSVVPPTAFGMKLMINKMVLELSFACWDYDRMKAIEDGRVRAEGIELNFLNLRVEETFFRQLRFREFDLSELSLSSYIMTLHQEKPPFIALPVFPSRFFRQQSMYINKNAGISKPQDLAGKKIGVPEYQMTAAVWQRGILEEYYGVPPSQVQFYVGAIERSDQERISKIPHSLLPDIKVAAISKEQNLSDMLANGELDAVFSASKPSSLETSENVGRLFSNFKEVEAEYFRKTQLFPIMHVVALKRDVYEKNPWIAKSLTKAFALSLDVAYESIQDRSALRYILPWLEDHVIETQALMGEKARWWQDGFQVNKHVIDKFLEYHHRQGLSPRRLKAEEIFAPNARETFVL